MLRTDTPLYRSLQWLIFPVLFIGPLWGAAVLIGAGYSVAIVTYGVIAAMWIAFLALEWLMPFRRDWNTPAGDLRNDTISALIAYGLLPALLKPVFYAILAGAAAWLALQWGGNIWPTHWPLWAQLIILMLAGDAGRYWGHRLAHEVPLLWRFHAVHHSATRLWFFNAMRQHPVDKTVFTFTELLFPILLGAQGDVLALYLIATASCGYFQHCNIDVKLGPLYYIFNIVDLHRWHHSREIWQSNNNYGNNLIVYDILFGTRYLPKDEPITDIGLINPDYPQTYWQQFMAPFRKGNLDKEVGRRV